MKFNSQKTADFQTPAMLFLIIFMMLLVLVVGNGMSFLAIVPITLAIITIFIITLAISANAMLLEKLTKLEKKHDTNS